MSTPLEEGKLSKESLWQTGNQVELVDSDSRQESQGKTVNLNKSNCQ